MATHRWADLKHKASPERQAEMRRWAKEEAARLEVIELNLRALREMLGKTQEELAAAVEITQAELSRAERREDHLVSTLRRYVEALGGSLDVVATFGDKKVKLQGV
jgi:DNA-binding XRE family transcriptional regulator